MRSADRSWWEQIPRDEWGPRKLPVPPKPVRDALRYSEEAQAVIEYRAVGMRVRVYR